MEHAKRTEEIRSELEERKAEATSDETLSQLEEEEVTDAGVEHEEVIPAPDDGSVRRKDQRGRMNDEA